MNPILPKEYYIPDVEARQWEDGKVYLYGSNDICGADYYCSHIYRVFSSDDMKEWVAHDVSFTGYDRGENRAVVPGILYAPDCICIDGEYCLFYCQENGAEGIAVSESPAGPFIRPHVLEYADMTQIDPAAFQDEDGTVYYYWGQMSARAGILNKEKTGLVKESIVEGILTEEEHGFHEGISVRKRNGIYYAVYTDISRGNATCIGYATGTSPLGPFKKQGIIIDNTACDPSSWNNHGSIAEINGKWYVFYHRSTHNSRFSRRVCAEPIDFDANGRIKEVEMTTQGTEGPMNTRKLMEASNACLLSGEVYIDTDENKNEFLGHMKEGDWACYKYYNFQGDESEILMEATVGGASEVWLYTDAPDGKYIGSIEFAAVSHGQSVKGRGVLQEKIKGVHALYMEFKGEGKDFLQIWNFTFR